MADDSSHKPQEHLGFVNGIVHAFLYSNLSIILVLLAAALGMTALLATPREEDPQIVVPLADVYVQFPGHSAEEVEQLVATPLEKLLFEIDGVEYVYSMSSDDMAVITVRFHVGEDRERSLVKIYKRIDEHVDLVPPGVTGWVVKPVEIDDVPIVTLTLASSISDELMLRRVGEEVVERLASVENLSRAYVVGGSPRVVSVYLDADRMVAHSVSPLDVEKAIRASNVSKTSGEFSRDDSVLRVEVDGAFRSAVDIENLVVGVFDGRPVFLKDFATVVDGPSEVTSYVRHGFGPARNVEGLRHFTGTLIGPPAGGEGSDASRSAVTIAVAKKKGTNAVTVAEEVFTAVEALKRDVIPSDMDLVVTRNYGLTADHKVNELIEALAVAVFIVVALLTLSLGWRESLIVAVAVPVVFGLTLLVNMLFGFTINRVTLFALILSLGLLVDDPIVDVENIVRHFKMRGKATRWIVLEAVSEIRPPLITATLAVIVSFLPLFFITGMMGPYMAPMALNVPTAMVTSMLVAFTITPWLAYHVLKRRYNGPAGAEGGGSVPSADDASSVSGDSEDVDLESLRRSFLYRLFYPLMAPLLKSKARAWSFIVIIGGLTALAAGLAATRSVPLKMLPFDNKNELLLLVDMEEGTTLERTDAMVRELEDYLQGVTEVTDYTSYVGVASPMDFNGLVRHYYLREGEHLAAVQVNLVGKKSRSLQSHGLALRDRDKLTEIARERGAILQIVETPPGPPVLASVVAEVYGRDDHTHDDLVAAAGVVRARMEREPGVVEVDDRVESDQTKLVFVPDQEKAALSGVSVSQIAETVSLALGGSSVGTVRMPRERDPLLIELRFPRAVRSSASDLAAIRVKSSDGDLVPLAELGRWEDRLVGKTIYHKNLRRVVYVSGGTAGRPPADVVVDILADKVDFAGGEGAGFVSDSEAKAVSSRTFLASGGGVEWGLEDGFVVDFAGEGEWKITLDVFRDLGLAFAAAMVGIYILLVAQTRSFVIPLVVMMAIPLTVLGIMPGFWLLNAIVGGDVGGYANPVFFTATGMIGMIALAGIVTRDSIILVDFIHLSLKRGRSLFDAIMESRVVRLRPILLTSATAMLSAAPITLDPIFSGLAWALIFGVFASTVFTLFVIPVTYWLMYADKPGHGLGVVDEAD